MICELVLIMWAQQFIQGSGSWAFKDCYYVCDNSPDPIFYRVDPTKICPGSLKNARSDHSPGRRKLSGEFNAQPDQRRAGH